MRRKRDQTQIEYKFRTNHILKCENKFNHDKDLYVRLDDRNFND